jgi:hypothetical protein
MPKQSMSIEKRALRLESIYDYERQPEDRTPWPHSVGCGRGQLCPGYSSVMSAPWRTSAYVDLTRLHWSRPLNGFPEFS